MKALICGAILCAIVAPLPALADSPFDGTWKGDVSAAQMPKKPDIYVLKDGTYSCKTCAPAYTVKADGMDHAISGHPYIDTVAIKVVDVNTIEETDKKGGKTVATSKVSVAPGGKMATFEFSDSSDTNGGAPVTGKGTIRKVAAGPAGSHAVSGSWITTGYQSLSDNAVTVTYKTNGDMLSMSTPTGQFYSAKMDGTDAPMKGDPGITSVRVEMMGPALVETDKRNGKVVSRSRITVSKDGKTMSIALYDALHDRSVHWTAAKQ